MKRDVRRLSTRLVLSFVLAATALPALAQEPSPPAIGAFAGVSLQAAQSAALAHAPGVAAAQYRVEETQAALAAARGLGAPQATLGYAQAPQGGTTSTITQRLVTLGGQVTLGDYFRRDPFVRQAQSNLRAAQFDLQNAQRTERITIIGAYFKALQTAATVRLREAALRTAQADRNAAHKRYAAGEVPRLDVVRGDVAIAQAQADLETARADSENARSALAIQTGEPLAAFSGVVAAAPPSNAIPDNPQTAARRAELLRPDVAAAQANVKAEAAAVRVASRGVLPSVVISGGYTTGVDSGIHVQGPSANVLVSLPVSHQSKDLIAEERARLAQTQAKLASVQQSVQIEVGAAVRSYDASVRATAAATRARQAAQSELHATEIGYRSGASSSLDLADARRTYDQAVVSELNARYNQAQARATLSVLIGE
ncbi:MAG TPA: TolC family protein [Candidatus Baltobacteraceae bacterium]|jgi:outer membrane protein TolC